MKKIVLHFTLLFILNFIFSQNQFSEKIKQDCLEMAKAMKNKDFNTILNFTYPKIVEMGGGKSKLISLMKTEFDKMEKDGFYFESIIFETPQEIYKAGNELHCIIPEQIILKTPKGKIKAIYYILAISKDKGKKWYFLETHKFNDENLKLILPNFNKNMIIPKNTKPVLIE